MKKPPEGGFSVFGDTKRDQTAVSGILNHLLYSPLLADLRLWSRFLQSVTSRPKAGFGHHP